MANSPAGTAKPGSSEQLVAVLLSHAKTCVRDGDEEKAIAVLKRLADYGNRHRAAPAATRDALKEARALWLSLSERKHRRIEEAEDDAFIAANLSNADVIEQRLNDLARAGRGGDSKALRHGRVLAARAGRLISDHEVLRSFGTSLRKAGQWVPASWMFEEAAARVEKREPHLPESRDAAAYVTANVTPLRGSALAAHRDLYTAQATLWRYIARDDHDVSPGRWRSAARQQMELLLEAKPGYPYTLSSLAALQIDIAQSTQDGTALEPARPLLVQLEQSPGQRHVYENVAGRFNPVARDLGAPEL